MSLKPGEKVCLDGLDKGISIQNRIVPPKPAPPGVIKPQSNAAPPKKQ